MRYKELTEGIQDKGIFKAMFFAGLPGAGKTTIAARVTDGTVEPRIVNTDRGFEYLVKRAGAELSGDASWALFGPASKSLNATMLGNYFNGMLPLFIDGTSANPNAALRRAGIAESLGYDTAMIWVNIDYDTAIDRISKRERQVNPDFVKRVYEAIVDNKELYKNRFGENFIEVDNNSDNFSAMEGKVYNITNQFFSSPVQNAIGSRQIAYMNKAGEKYLVPGTYDKEYIDKIVGVWYMK